MMTLARSLSAAALSAASARAGSTLSSSMSNTLPWRTLATPEMPSDLSAPSIALPCWSSTPGLRVTVTRAFIAKAASLLAYASPEGGGRRGRGAGWGNPGAAETKRPPPAALRAATLPLRGRDYPSALHQHRAGALRTLVLAHDAEAPGDFGIGLHEPAEV